MITIDHASAILSVWRSILACTPGLVILVICLCKSWRAQAKSLRNYVYTQHSQKRIFSFFLSRSAREPGVVLLCAFLQNCPNHVCQSSCGKGCSTNHVQLQLEHHLSKAESRSRNGARPASFSSRAAAHVIGRHHSSHQKLRALGHEARKRAASCEDVASLHLQHVNQKALRRDDVLHIQNDKLASEACSGHGGPGKWKGVVTQCCVVHGCVKWSLHVLFLTFAVQHSSNGRNSAACNGCQKWCCLNSCGTGSSPKPAQFWGTENSTERDAFARLDATCAPRACVRACVRVHTWPRITWLQGCPAFERSPCLQHVLLGLISHSLLLSARSAEHIYAGLSQHCHPGSSLRMTWLQGGRECYVVLTLIRQAMHTINFCVRTIKNSETFWLVTLSGNSTSKYRVGSFP